MVAGPIYEFGEFRLDCGRFELLRDGRSLRLERKPMELLTLLAESKGQLVTRADIAKRLWDSEVFVDTEHGINTAIRKIRQVLRDDSEEPSYVLTVTGMGYRFIAPLTVIESSAVVEAPPTAELAGSATGDAPEASPQTRRPNPPPVAGPEASPNRPLSVRLAALAGYVALTAFFVLIAIGVKPLEDRLLHRGAQLHLTSLAVLPLDNLSGDAGQDYFADGMTDELITMLAKNSTLRITSRTSVMQYKGARKPLPEIARALGVEGILEGSVERTNGQVHMTLQLIRADTDTHLWAESYYRDANAVAALPGEAARAIAIHLHSSVPSSNIARYVNPEAHDAYLRGRYAWFQGQNEEAGRYFRKATQLQPDYAPGWSGLSIYYGAGAVQGILKPADSLPLEESAANMAVQLDDSFPEAHLALCAAIFINHWDWARADQECRRAIDLDPKFAEAWHFRAKIFAALNRHQEAIEFQKKASELDPFQRPFALAYSYLLARQYDAAVTNAKELLESSPNDIDLHWVLGEAYRCKGESKEVVAEWQRVATLQGFASYPAVIRREYARGGYKAVVRERINYMTTRPLSQYVSPVDLALLYAQLGDRGRTLALLEQGYQQRTPEILWIQCDPAYDFLHADPRYRSLIQRIGLPPEY
jgi:TolB-like protein/DNA-binding winged helix-turn-helix (wHTH) protein/Tfp pilus assembly protein PilF